MLVLVMALAIIKNIEINRYVLSPSINCIQLIISINEERKLKQENGIVIV
jgi:hypothetical protein